MILRLMRRWQLENPENILPKISRGELVSGSISGLSVLAEGGVFTATRRLQTLWVVTLAKLKHSYLQGDTLTQRGKTSPVSPSPDEPSIWQTSHSERALHCQLLCWAHFQSLVIYSTTYEMRGRDVQSNQKLVSFSKKKPHIHNNV